MSLGAGGEEVGGGWALESGGGQARGGWINESVYLVSVGGWVCVCVGVLSVGLGPGLDSMSPARSRRSASHAAGTHGRLPQKTGRPGLRRGGVGGYNLHSVPPNSPPDCGTVAHQPRAGCIRLVLCDLFFCAFTMTVIIVEGSAGAFSMSCKYNIFVLGP